jgi:hypothetical protein
MLRSGVSDLETVQNFTYDVTGHLTEKPLTRWPDVCSF